MENNKSKKVYAFIDAQNTASTTWKLLGFIIDWNKLCNYLIEKWKCEKVFLYSGIDEGDEETAKEFESLSKIPNVIVRAKTIFAYKRPSKIISSKCVECGKENAELIDMGYIHKSNCDVELAVDAMEESGSNREFLIFTGDGDFEYLIRRALEKGTRIYIVSSNAGVRKPGINTKRLSTKLKKLVKEFRGVVNMINIDNWKYKIKKDV